MVELVIEDTIQDADDLNSIVFTELLALVGEEGGYTVASSTLQNPVRVKGSITVERDSDE